MAAFTLVDLFERMAAAGASDLHLCAGSPPVLRVRGELERLDLPEVSAEEMRALVYRITTLDQQKELEVERELDFSYALADKWRFRLNASYDRDSVACAVRLVPASIPTLEDLRMPEIVRELAFRPRGLVLVTGPTGSGKSTTLAAMVDAINDERACHIVTVEDPIEFVHSHKRAVVNQREVGGGHTVVRTRAPLGVAPGPRCDPRRRAARPRIDLDRAHRRRDRAISSSRRCIPAAPPARSTASSTSSRTSSRRRCACSLARRCRGSSPRRCS